MNHKTFFGIAFLALAPMALALFEPTEHTASAKQLFSLQTVATGAYNVKSFGAKGDGTTWTRPL
jgi:hypothetical protein